MRHHKSGRKLGRDSAHRKALYANLTSALIEHGRIRTTEAKAKEVRPIVEQMITLGKRGDVHAHRQAVAFLRSKPVAHKLFEDVAPRFADRPGRLHPDRASIGPRQGDCGADGLPRAGRLPAEGARRDSGTGPRSQSCSVASP